PNTVMRAYDALCQGGIITPSRGIGYFISEGARERALAESRREFVERDLMELFRRMETLGFTPNELTELYTNYQKRERDENK
ncbi:MAG: GntR family transcriptional regulator, partial [Tidjanibacter sp.]|nr:GntR family transcriptional regulator [Tidjanibacter sp.]